MSYFGVGMYMPKTSENIGTLWRSAKNFGASFMFTVGTRSFLKNAADTEQSWKDIPFYVYPTWEDVSIPTDCFLVGIEQCELSVELVTFEHPKRACYILGAEDGGLPKKIWSYCTGGIIQIPTPNCINVAVAGSIVLYDRVSKQAANKV